MQDGATTMHGNDDDGARIAREAVADGAILFDSRRLAQADASLLRPDGWPAARAATGEGGRGAVWFVEGHGVRGVLRHYRRGGFVGRVVHDRYLWRGEDATRSFREFRLLAQLRAAGMNVPEPLLAGYARRGIGYRADIVTGLIADARSLAQQARAALPAAAAWHAIGVEIARLHRLGVHHADLNAHNVMLDDAGRAWLLDFDRGAQRASGGDWKAANLARLQRSLRKLAIDRAPGFARAWSELELGYREAGA